MSIPREGSRDTSEGLVISTCPDVCLTPRGAAMVPVPYSIVAKQSDDANTAKSVLMTSLRTHTTGSIITTCKGDAPGTGKGVKSGTVEGICEPMTFSTTVRAEGKNVIRHNDKWHMNNKNTKGNLNYVKPGKQYAQASTGTIKPGKQYAQASTDTMNDANSSAPVASTRPPPPGGLDHPVRDEVVNAFTGGDYGKNVAKLHLMYLESFLKGPLTPPLSNESRQVVQDAINDIKSYGPNLYYRTVIKKVNDAIEKANAIDQAKADGTVTVSPEKGN